MKHRFSLPSLIIVTGFLALVLLTPVSRGVETNNPVAKPSPRPTPTPVPPTYEHVAYGSETNQWLNFWQAKSTKDGRPAPLIFNIHGGGWRHGPIEPFQRGEQTYLDHGISVVHITYRFTPGNPLPAPVTDAVRALQFVKSKASEWNIDPTRIILTGGSAGGCSTLWIATHHDLADPSSQDPLKRQSTKVAGAIAWIAQSTIEPQDVLSWLGTNTLNHPMICNAGGFMNNEQMHKAIAERHEVPSLYREYSPINHINTNEPPILMQYGPMNEKTRDDIHSGVFGIKFKERADQLGVTNCYLSIEMDPAFQGYPGGGNAFINMIFGGEYLPIKH